MAGGGLLVVFGLRLVQINQAIQKLAVRPLNQLQAGLQAMTGRLIAVEETLVTRFERPNVVYFRTVLERWHSGRNGGRWVKWAEETQTVPTLLDDGSGGVVEVRLKDVEPNLNQDESARAKGMIFEKPDPRVVAFAERVGKDATGLLGTARKMRLREFALENGESVHVCGPVDFSQAKWPVVEAPQNKTPFRLTDKGRDGLFKKQLIGGYVVLGIGVVLDVVGVGLTVTYFTG